MTSFKNKLAVYLCAGALGALAAGCASTPTRESTGEYVDDSTLTAKVKAAILHDEGTKALDIHVNTYKGNVQLSGWANTPEQKEAAGHDAAAVNGVHDVTNNITVKQ